MKRAKTGGAAGSTAAGVAVGTAVGPAAGPEESTGWFTVSRAAHLLGVPLPRVFDSIRDGKLEVRFEPGKPGESDRPFVTSAELRAKTGASATGPTDVAAPGNATSSSPMRSAPLPAPIPAAASSTVASAPPPVASPRLPSAAEVRLAEEARTRAAQLQAELDELRRAYEESEERADAGLKAIYERDVQIARLEAEVAANGRLREENETFIRHLEARLDKTEERSDEKEKEIRRLAVGLGEARGEIRLLKPPESEPPPAWKRRTAAALLLLAAAAAAGLLGLFCWQLAARSLLLHAGVVAGVGVVLAFVAGWMLDRIRRAK